jgi:hypothetical protein
LETQDFQTRLHAEDGARVESANYAVEISFRARRIKWSLATPNREAAAARAKEIYLSLQAVGWEETIKRYRPQEAPKSSDPDITVGEFLAEARRVARLKPATFNDYAEAFRRIISDIASISGGKTVDFVFGLHIS